MNKADTYSHVADLIVKLNQRDAKLVARLADENDQKGREIKQLQKANEHWHLRVSQLKTDNDAYSEENERLRAALEGEGSSTPST